jgi:pimeloyl-ACP methyl ester carboxylesterase
VAPIQREEVELHGHLVGYQIAGEGPVVGLIHGITSIPESWRRVIPRLAERYTVVAPDLLGHGGSAKPQGDYSLGAYASGIRDLMGCWAARWSGTRWAGVSRSSSPTSSPSTASAWCWSRAGGSAATCIRCCERPRSRARSWCCRCSPATGACRRGRRYPRPWGGSACGRDRTYLAENLPTLIVWGTDDPIIPRQHGRAAAGLIPGCKLVEIEGAGHWPQLDEPDLLSEALIEFIEGSEPYEFDIDRMREQLRLGAPAAAPPD